MRTRQLAAAACALVGVMVAATHLETADRSNAGAVGSPWTATLNLTRQPDDSVFEYACHEGNNSMRNIPSASRAAERP
jgi:hypothetical protein